MSKTKASDILPCLFKEQLGVLSKVIQGYPHFWMATPPYFK